MLTITHTHEAGTLIEGTERGDGTAPILKTNRWRWGRSIGAWYLPRSRDAFANRGTIDRTAEQLRAAGHRVQVHIDNTPREVGAAEADKAAQAAARADALATKAQRRDHAAAVAWETDRRATDSLPPDGQPILVGHHSETRHRRAIERSWQTLGHAVAATNEAEEAHRRADVAARAHTARHNPLTVANRIQRLDAEIRGYDRTIAAVAAVELRVSDIYSSEVRQRRDHAQSQRDHWADVRAQQQASGQASDYGPHNFSKGDAVRIRGVTAAPEMTNSWCPLPRALATEGSPAARAYALGRGSPCPPRARNSRCSVRSRIP